MLNLLDEHVIGVRGGWIAYEIVSDRMDTFILEASDGISGHHHRTTFLGTQRYSFL